MVVNKNLFWILSGFFLLAAAGYTVWSIIDFQGNPAGRHAPGVEWVGTVGITLSAILSAFLAFYLTITHRGQGGELPEDRLDAAIDDGDPEIGHFAPWSWWPFVLGVGLSLAFLGLAVGIWVSFIGAPIVIVGLIGWYYEFYRNNFAR